MGIADKTIKCSLLASLLFQAVLGTSSLAATGRSASYLYNLSNFTGVVPFTWVRVVPDPAEKVVYVCNGGEVYIFNATGMEIYRFGEDARLGYAHDIAVLEDGDILLLSYFWSGFRTGLIRCNYRGEVLKSEPLTGLPEGWGGFQPTRMVLRGEKLYVADLSGMRVAVLDLGGSFRESIDLGATLQMSGRQVAESGINGFDVDDRGNIYFTIPTRFTVYRLSPQGVLESFGKPGGTPGKFGVVAGVTADRSGAIYVVDTLKCVVSVFDREFRFLYEFGHRTGRPGGLVAPKEVTISADGKVYVTQQANRGVSVYTVGSN